ncbi:MAG TPA: phosphatase PAP2 family protein [Flavisolibacter sp.]|jgi:membrane-associated phospholipid phosphatase|nr:phosphatase PAP2 family protein [Flavisolibacter sp.]
MKLQSKEYQHYRVAVLVCLAMSFLVGVFVAVYGRQESFLFINGSNSTRLDYFFTYLTYLGDGIIWVPLFLYVLLYKRHYFMMVLASLVICTFLTHFLKRVVFADEARPLRALHDLARAVPLMNGKDAYANSFPSGHTSTAFTLALLLAIIINKKWAAVFFPLIAFFVGYSRVYLAQHFVTDVLAGMIVGVISSYLSILVYLHFKKRSKERRSKLSQ